MEGAAETHADLCNHLTPTTCRLFLASPRGGKGAVCLSRIAGDGTSKDHVRRQPLTSLVNQAGSSAAR